MNDKGSITEIASFELKPVNFVLVLTQVLARPGENSAKLTESVSKVAILARQLLELCGDLYARPDFRG